MNCHSLETSNFMHFKWNSWKYCPKGVRERKVEESKSGRPKQSVWITANKPKIYYYVANECDNLRKSVLWMMPGCEYVYMNSILCSHSSKKIPNNRAEKIQWIIKSGKFSAYKCKCHIYLIFNFLLYLITTSTANTIKLKYKSFGSRPPQL